MSSAFFLPAAARLLADGVHWTAASVFLFFFLLVSMLGFVAAYWHRPETLAHIDE